MTIIPLKPSDNTNNMFIPPSCTDEGGPSKCRFILGISQASTMHSPIEYNREGVPIGGGANTLTKILHCKNCTKNWTSIQTELEDLQKKERQWKEKK